MSGLFVALRPVEPLHALFIAPVALAARGGFRAGLVAAAFAVGFESMVLWATNGTVLGDGQRPYVIATWGLFFGFGIGATLFFRYLAALQHRTETAERRLAQQNAVLAEIGKIVTSPLSIEDMLERCAKKVDKLIPFDRIAIALVDPKHQAFCKVYVHGLGTPREQQGMPFPMAGTLTQEVTADRRGTIVVAEDESDIAARYPGLSPKFRAGFKTFLCVPLISQGDAIGALHFMSTEAGAYGPQDLQAAERVSAHIAGAISHAQHHEWRKVDEEKLRRQSEAMNASIDGIALVDTKGEFIYVNDALVEMFGYEGEGQLVGKPWSVLYGRDQMDTFDGEIIPALQRDGYWRGEVTGTRSDGNTFPQEISMKTLQGGGLVCVDRDITERKQLEEQFIQSQKMEAVGTLAGGVAHDFNNVLSAVTGYAGLALMNRSVQEPVAGYLKEIQIAAERASDLTKQLLAFSRRQTVQPHVVDLNELILNMDRMLRRIMGEDTEIVTFPGPDLGRVRVDPGQMEQVLINLAANARDAMPEGGKLIIESTDVVLDDSSVGQREGIAPGEYVRLSITDTGCGMTGEVLSRAFEPFFTTKQVGKGSGLGLSTCHGIVGQAGGHILVDSELGEGTTFTIYLPRVEEPADPKPAPKDYGELPGGSETVLLVEDEPMVRSLAAEVLRQHGYTVLEASNGFEALAIADTSSHPDIDLVLTDIVMPLMGGPVLASQLREMRPGTKILYTSGYPDDTIANQGLLDPSPHFMEKPFTPSVLARKVREALDG